MLMLKFHAVSFGLNFVLVTEGRLEVTSLMIMGKNQSCPI
jgi:hypothetical protein